MAAPEAIKVVYDETEMTVEQEDAVAPRCIQLMFDAFVHLFKYFIDPSLPQLVAQTDEDEEEQEQEEQEQEEQEEQLSLKDIETIQELNAELDKMSDEAKQCIAELEWFIQKYPENVVLKELEPIIADLEELRKTNNGIDVQEQDQDQDQDQEQVQEQEQVCVQE